MVRYLSEHDVERLVDMPTAIQAVSEAFCEWAEGRADNVPRTRAAAPGIVLHSMSAAAEYLGLVGWKCYTTTRQGAQFLMGVYDQTSGRLRALIEANRLGQLRTGAVSGVAIRALSSASIGELGLFGCGWQAEGQLLAAAAVRPIERAFVYSRSADRRQAFAERLGKLAPVEVIPVDRPQEAAEDLPLVITATSSLAPVFEGSWLAEESLVVAMGSNWPKRAEIDALTVRRADLVVCDSVRACQNEAGDFRDALEKGDFTWSRAVELADVVTGRASHPYRGRLTIFKSVGLAIEDLALAAHVIERAEEAGVGTKLPI